MTVQNIILNYLKEKDDWVFGGLAEREATSLHKPATISRELRRMSEIGLISKRKVKYAGVNVVQYKIATQPQNSPLVAESNSSYMSDYELATML